MAQPDMRKKYSYAEAKLYRRARTFPSGEVCDQVIVQHFTGNEDNIVIYEKDGKKNVARLRIAMTFSPSSPAVSTTPSINEFVEPLDAKDERRLLETYEDLLAATKIRECVCINPGLNGPGTRVVDPNDLTQAWRVTFGDGFVGEVRISPTEGTTHKGKVKDMVAGLALSIRKRGEQFPYSTNNLSASLNAA